MTEAFDDVVQAFAGRAGVTRGSGFGSVPGLRVGDRIFAMLCRGELVVKLPEARVDDLVASGSAERFDARGDGRRMREWASVAASRAGQWPALAEEARDFVAGLRT